MHYKPALTADRPDSGPSLPGSILSADPRRRHVSVPQHFLHRRKKRLWSIQTDRQPDSSTWVPPCLELNTSARVCQSGTHRRRSFIVCRLCANWPTSSETRPCSAKPSSHVSHYWEMHQRTGPNSADQPESASGSGESWFEPRRGNLERDIRISGVALFLFGSQCGRGPPGPHVTTSLVCAAKALIPGPCPSGNGLLDFAILDG